MNGGIGHESGCLERRKAKRRSVQQSL